MRSVLEVPVGKDHSGTKIYCDLTKTSTTLIAGALREKIEGCVNSMLFNILHRKNSCEDVRLLIADTDGDSFCRYDGIPHLLKPRAVDASQGIKMLEWTVAEMNRRIKLYRSDGCADIYGYNRRFGPSKALPVILLVISDLADLIRTDEKRIVDLLRDRPDMYWRSGVHMLAVSSKLTSEEIGSDVLRNFLSRIAFRMESDEDLQRLFYCEGDGGLSDELDMLYCPLSYPRPVACKSAVVSDSKIAALCDSLRQSIT